MSSETKVSSKVVQVIESNTNDDIMPSLNVNVPQKKEEERTVIKNEEMVTLYKEILDYCRKDRQDADDAFKTFLEMVVNEGDATSSSKEAMVNLLKTKVEATDKMTKVMDLLMRYVLKDRDTFPRYLAANQENNIIVKGGNKKRSFLEKIEKMQKDNKESK
jgi:cellobiose-specific phosphotransferase system component IIA